MNHLALLLVAWLLGLSATQIQAKLARELGRVVLMMCKNFGELWSTDIGDIKYFRFSYSKSTGSPPLQFQASQAIHFQNISNSGRNGMAWLA